MSTRNVVAALVVIVAAFATGIGVGRAIEQDEVAAAAAAEDSLRFAGYCATVNCR